MAPPLVSLVLIVRNGLPYLEEALRSVEAQTFRDFELIAQDGASTDGTTQMLSERSWVDLVSEPDNGVGDAFNRAVARCRGRIVGSIDADNLLEAEALERAVEIFEAQPDLAAVSGGARMIGPAGEYLGHDFVPQPFDLLRVLACEVVPPFGTSFFNLPVCGDLLRSDVRLSTCADYDIWLRMAHLPIASTPELFGATRLSASSMSRRADEYDVHVANKRQALEWFLAPYEGGVLIDAVRRRATAGILLWAAEAVHSIEEGSDRFHRYLSEAAELEPDWPRLDQVRALAAAGQEDRDEPDSHSIPVAEGSPARRGRLFGRARRD